jgi:hypothetical protein
LDSAAAACVQPQGLESTRAIEQVTTAMGKLRTGRYPPIITNAIDIGDTLELVDERLAEYQKWGA